MIDLAIIIVRPDSANRAIPSKGTGISNEKKAILTENLPTEKDPVGISGSTPRYREISFFDCLARWPLLKSTMPEQKIEPAQVPTYSEGVEMQHTRSVASERTQTPSENEQGTVENARTEYRETQQLDVH